MHRLLTTALTLLLLATPHAAVADSWMPPRPVIVESKNRSFRLAITPREISSPLGYFSDKVAGREPAGQAAGETAKTASARLERRDAQGRWSTVWQKPLVNEVAPVSAFVSDDGQYTVTLDDWHLVGTSQNTVVVYGSDGGLIRRMALTDILPADYVFALPHSVSSIQWRPTDPDFSPDGQTFVLRVAVPESDPLPRDREKTVDIAVNLKTGSTAPRDGPAWETSLAQARTIAADKRAAPAAGEAAFIAPLKGPSIGDERHWHDYLRDAFFRVDPDWEEDFPATKVLRDPAAANYRISETWIDDALRQKEYPQTVVMIASVAPPEHLVSVLSASAQRVRRGSLKTVRVYVAAPAAYEAQLADILKPTGAHFRLLDPAVPILQRPERIKMRNGG